MPIARPSVPLEGPFQRALADDSHRRVDHIISELKDLLRELDESYARQELLGRIDNAILASAASNLGVLSLIINEGIEQSDAAHGQVVESREGQLLVVASSDRQRIGTSLPPDHSLCGRAIREGHSLRVDDVSALTPDQYVRFHPDTRSELAVLIRHGNSQRTLGVLNLERPAPGPFPAAGLAFAFGLASQLAIALQQSRERESVTGLVEALTDITSGAVSASQGYARLFAVILFALDASNGNLVEWTGTDFLVVASTQVQDVGIRYKSAGSITGRYCVDENGQDLLNIPDIQRSIYATDYLRMLSSHGEPMVSELILPLHLDDKLLGALNIESRRSYAFTEFEEQLLRYAQRPLALALRSTAEHVKLLRQTRFDASVAALSGMSGSAVELIHTVGGDLSEVRSGLYEVLEQVAEMASPEMWPDGLRTSIEELIAKAQSANEELARIRSELDPSNPLYVAAPHDLGALAMSEIDRAQIKYPEIAIGLRVEVDAAGLPPPLVIVNGLMTRVIWNVLDNAGRSVSERWGSVNGGRIDVTLDAPNRATVRLRVRDNGGGMSAAVLRKIFDYGFRGRATSAEGQGVGLYWCRQYLLLQGGDIGARSRRGSYAEVTISLAPSLM